MAYQYKGKQLDAHLPVPDGRGTSGPSGPAKCGTRPGYARHKRLAEDVCEKCREAKNEYDRGYRAAKKGRGGH